MYLLKKQQQKNLILKVYKASTYELRTYKFNWKTKPSNSCVSSFSCRFVLRLY